MGTIKTTNIETITGSGTLTLGQSGETITIPSGVTMTNNGVMSGQNYPAFVAFSSVSQTIVDVTTTKVVFNSEVFDTDSCFDSTTNNRFTPTVSGKYFCFASTTLGTTTFPNSAIDEMRILFYKNGSKLQQMIIDFKANPVRYGYLHVNNIIEFNGSSDYLEVFAFIDSNTGTPSIQANSEFPTYFGAYRIGS